MTGTATIRPSSYGHGSFHSQNNNTHHVNKPSSNPTAEDTLPGLKNCTPQAIGAAALLGAMMYMDKGIGDTRTGTQPTNVASLHHGTFPDNFEDDMVSIPCLDDASMSSSSPPSPPPNNRKTPPSPPPIITARVHHRPTTTCHRRPTVASPIASTAADLKQGSSSSSSTFHDYYKQTKSRVFPVVSGNSSSLWLSSSSSPPKAPMSSSPTVARVSAATMLNLQSRERGRPMKQVVRGESPAEGVTTAPLKVAAMMRGGGGGGVEETITTQTASTATTTAPSTTARRAYRNATFKVYCNNKTDRSSTTSTNYRIHCEAKYDAVRNAIAHRLGVTDNKLTDTLGLNGDNAFVVEYVDGEGDTCVLSSDDDVLEAIRTAAATQQAVVKLTVTVPSLKDQLVGAWKKQSWW